MPEPLREPLRERIAVDESLPPVCIPGPVLNEALLHARQAFPEECCGLLTGSPSRPFGSCHPCANDMSALHRRDPVRHPRDNHHGFHMRETDYLRVTQDAEAKGEHVTGVYHSHAGAEVYFSEVDQAYALGEAAVKFATEVLTERYAMDFENAVRRYAVLGTPADVAARIAEFHAAGVRHFVFDWLAGPAWPATRSDRGSRASPGGPDL